MELVGLWVGWGRRWLETCKITNTHSHTRSHSLSLCSKWPSFVSSNCIHVFLYFYPSGSHMHTHVHPKPHTCQGCRHWAPPETGYHWGSHCSSWPGTWGWCLSQIPGRLQCGSCWGPLRCPQRCVSDGTWGKKYGVKVTICKLYVC